MGTSYSRNIADYVKLEFNGGEEVICFDTMEVREDVEITLGCIAEIFESRSGYGTAIARKKPRKVTVPIYGRYADTWYKWKRIAALTCGRYRCRLIFSRYYTVNLPIGTTCPAGITISPDGVTWYTGSQVADTVFAYFDGMDVVRSDIDLDPPDNTVVSNLGILEPIGGAEGGTRDDNVVIGGSIGTLGDAQDTIEGVKGWVWEPFAMDVVVSWDGVWDRFARGCGVTKQTINFTFTESRPFEVPVAVNIVPDPLPVTGSPGLGGEEVGETG